MKWRFAIAFLWVLLAACTPRNDAVSSVETRQGTPLPTEASPALANIDSLMWRQPDSALTVLMDYFASRDSLSTTTFDNHYAQLLAAELLYKNDYQQTNRADLLQAVAYFDSLVREAPSFKGARGIQRTSDPNLFFLAARAHYINGVGYYEQDSVVPACQQYLKALEIMEGHFAEKELVGKKAIFMTYSYNRLMELFSAQFMMEPAITCGERSLSFCTIAPTSPYGVANILYHIGKQYDKMNELDKAKAYYSQALEKIPDTQNVIYRDIIVSKVLCDYPVLGIEKSLYELRKILLQANDTDEKLTRFLTIGDIFFEERLYDSALYYLEPVLEDSENEISQIQAANFLHIIYDSLEITEKLNECMRFLTEHKKSDGENKALVSKLNNMFQNYLDKKKERQAEEERAKSINRTIGIIVPIAVVVTLAIIVLAKLRGRKQLKEQQKETEKRLEAERQIHRTEQSALSGRLKRSNEELRELKDQIKEQQKVETMPKLQPEGLTFAEEPICRLIMERVNKGHFMSQMDCKIYKDYALDKNQLSALQKAVDHHFNQFTTRISRAYPELTRVDLDYCCLYLLNLTDADIAALMQRAYNTVNERSNKLKSVFGCENALSTSLLKLAEETTD